MIRYYTSSLDGQSAIECSEAEALAHNPKSAVKISNFNGVIISTLLRYKVREEDQPNNLWESLVWRGTENGFEIYDLIRYGSYAEAADGHEKLMMKYDTEEKEQLQPFITATIIGGK